MPDIAHILQSAMAHHQAGRLIEAERGYREVLAHQPRHAYALHQLGLLAHDAGQSEAALDLIRRAIAIDPAEPTFPANLGKVFRDLGRLDLAIEAYRAALRLRPELAVVHSNLGDALRAKGELEAAIGSLRTALRLAPDLALAHYNLGVALLVKQGNDAEAEACFASAVRFDPHFAPAHCNLGHCLMNRGEATAAVAVLRKAIELRPDYTQAYNNFGLALHTLGQLDASADAFQRALTLQPGAHQAPILNNLGNVLKDQGLLDGALECFRRAIAAQPDFVSVHSNLLYTLYLHPGYDAQAILEAHREWDRQHTERLVPHGPSRDTPQLDRNPSRRLRVGFVSSDLFDHVVGRFLLPLFREHDREQFEFVAYAGVGRPDAMTSKLRSLTKEWRSTLGMSDERLADVIRDDRIDILVDLTMHLANSRLLTFARRPAPVQVTYLAYPGTTGMPTMDFRITDQFLDPTPAHDALYTERSVRLADCYWCYEPHEASAASPVALTPAMQRGDVTFGCFNNFAKVSMPALHLWAKLLAGVPRSKLVIHAHEGSHRELARDVLSTEGVDPARLRFVTHQPYESYFAQYNEIDIALDPFPYAGGTTSCDALWMGVPVVTLAGQTAVARAGVSILATIGLPELVARSPDEYVRIAKELAGDVPRLAAIRAGMRARMRSSPLMDAPRFARGVEAALRGMWRSNLESA